MKKIFLELHYLPITEQLLAFSHQFIDLGLTKIHIGKLAEIILFFLMNYSFLSILIFLVRNRLFKRLKQNIPGVYISMGISVWQLKCASYANRMYTPIFLFFTCFTPFNLIKVGAEINGQEAGYNFNRLLIHCIELMQVNTFQITQTVPGRKTKRPWLGFKAKTCEETLTERN